MTVSWLLKPSPTSILIFLLMTLLTSACSTENSATPAHSNADINGIINSTKKIDTNTNYAALISGTDSGSVTEDNDPDGDNLLEVSGKLNITASNIDEAGFIATTHNGNYGSLTIDATGNWNYGADNNQSIIQNLASSDTLTDSLTVSSIDGTTHAIVITINGVDEIVTVATNTIKPDTSTTEPVSEPAPAVAMYSYNANLSDAQPLSAAVLEQTTVYIFFNNTSQYSSMNFYCCKGIDGTSTGEAHNAPVRDSSAPFVYSVDLSQYSTTGTRELYVDATRADGSGLDSIYANFSINITIIPIASEPTVSDVSLSWVAPAEREDNEPISLSEIAGYKVYYGTVQGDYRSSVVINDGSVTGHTLKDFPAGTYYFVVTTYDTEGRESQYSSEIKIVI